MKISSRVSNESHFVKKIKPAAAIFVFDFSELVCSDKTMPATFSNEGRILTALRDLELPARNCVDIAKSLNIQISHGRLNEALNDKGRLDDETGTKLVELLSELKAVREKFRDIPINWAVTERIATLVILERLTLISAELDQQRIAVQQ